MLMLDVTEGSQPAPIPDEPPPAPEKCISCGAAFPKDGAFCPNCGALRPSLVGRPLPYAAPHRMWPSYYAQPKTSWRVVSKSVAAMLMISVLVMIALMLVTLVYGALSIAGPAIVNGTEGLDHYRIFLVIPLFVTILTVSGTSLLTYYILIIGAIFASTTWIFATSARGFIIEMQGKAKSREHSALFDTFGLLFATIFFTYALILVILLFGGNTGSPSTGTIAESLFLLANASVWEELAVRVLLIGIPLLIIDIVRRKLQKKTYRYVLGGGFKFGIPEVILVLVSSMIFGIAHWVGGWPPWKVPDAAVAGLAFGYLFLKYGLPSAILLHFTTDYLSLPSQVFSTTTGGLTLITGLLVIGWAILGSVFFFYYASRIVEYLSGRTRFEGRPLMLGAPGVDPRFYGNYPPTYTYAPHPQIQPSTGQPHQPVTPGQTVSHGFGGGYVCPVCGYNQARWSEGRFQCLRCGHIS